MKKVFRVKEIMFIVGLVLTGLLFVACAGMAPGNDIVLKGANGREAAPLVLQELDYTENPVDIRNPDRGFVKSNDDHTSDGPLILPVSGNVAISQWTGKPWDMQYQPLTLGGVNPDRPVVTTNVRADPGVVQFYIDLRHFSSRSRLTNTGPTNPLTEFLLPITSGASS